jgi:acid phosphatase class B
MESKYPNKSLKDLLNIAIKLNNSLYEKGIDTSEIADNLNISFPNKLTELAFKRWINISFKPEDFILIKGHYFDKHSIYVKIKTLKYFENKFFYEYNSGFNDYTIPRKNRWDSKKLDINDIIKYRKIEDIIETFISLYTNRYEKDIDDALKDSFIFYLFKEWDDECFEIEERKFDHLNY